MTAYSSQQYPGLTTDGTPTIGNEGRIAAAQSYLPFGTMVTLEGVGTYRIADRGRLAENGIDIDVLMESTAAARAFGRQRVQACW